MAVHDIGDGIVTLGNYLLQEVRIPSVIEIPMIPKSSCVAVGEDVLSFLGFIGQCVKDNFVQQGWQSNGEFLRTIS